MNMKKTIIALLACSLGLLLPQVEVQAQNAAQLSGITAEGPYLMKKKGADVQVNMLMDLSQMAPMSSQSMLYVKPLIKSNTGSEEVYLEPFIIAGGKRYTVLQRHRKSDGSYKYGNQILNPKYVIKRKNNQSQTHLYQSTTAYKPWMQNASMVLQADQTGCALCPQGSHESILSSSALFPLYVPQYQYNYMKPAGELVKKREETLSAMLAFQVGRYEILPQFGNNPKELAEIDKRMKEFDSSDEIKFEELNMTGYASPEGGVDYNLQLSKNRALAFGAYLNKKYPILKNKFSNNWKGQDWDGLKKAVEASKIENQEQILDIIANTPVEQRQQALVAIDGGRTYQRLLSEYYPPLRRSELVFTLIVSGFEIERARQIMLTHPTRLILAEYYAVANSYPEGSADRKRTWQIAHKAFPEAVEPLHNLAQIELQSGEEAQALRRLEARKQEPRLWGLLGLAYAANQRWQEAEMYLKQAADKNLPGAAHNLAEYEKFAQDQF